MKIEKISLEDVQVSKWSGGSTTEYYISPKKSSVNEQDFEFRLSTANIESEFSNFTKFPKHNRILMILEGETEISHNDQESKWLKQFDLTCFSGRWNTFSKSKGVVMDFNLIYNDDYKSNVKFELINPFTEVSIRPNQWLFVYNHNGSLELGVLNNFYTIKSKEMIVIINDNQEKVLSLKGMSKCILTFLERIH